MTVATENRLEAIVDLLTSIKDAIATAREAGLSAADVTTVLDLAKTVVEEEE